MNVNQKGTIGLTSVINDLTKNEYECFIPIHDYSAVDLITINKNNKIQRIQVKYRESNKRNVIEINFKSVVNKKSIPIDFSKIDGWAVYCPEIEKVIYIGSLEVDKTKKSFRFRLTPGGNTVRNDTKKLKFYWEFKTMDTWPSG